MFTSVHDLGTRSGSKCSVVGGPKPPVTVIHDSDTSLVGHFAVADPDPDWGGGSQMWF